MVTGGAGFAGVTGAVGKDVDGGILPACSSHDVVSVELLSTRLGARLKSDAAGRGRLAWAGDVEWDWSLRSAADTAEKSEAVDATHEEEGVDVNVDVAHGSSTTAVVFCEIVELSLAGSRSQLLSSSSGVEMTAEAAVSVR
jgi:hypothetical protein